MPFWLILLLLVGGVAVYLLVRYLGRPASGPPASRDPAKPEPSRLTGEPSAERAAPASAERHPATGDAEPPDRVSPEAAQSAPERTPTVDASPPGGGHARPERQGMALGGSEAQPEQRPAELPSSEPTPDARPDGEGVAPERLDRPDEVDDLKRISGIGPAIERTLNELGIYRFAQIAAFTPENVVWVDRHLPFRGRIEREEWVDQARALIAEREGHQPGGAGPSQGGVGPLH